PLPYTTLFRSSGRNSAISIRISTPSKPIPVSVTAGAMADSAARFGRLLRSLKVRALIVVALFVALPPILYLTFRQADLDRQKLLLESIRVKGLTVGRVLEERLQRADMIPLFRLGEELARFQTEGVSLRLLFRPHDAPPDAGFLYVASAPAIPPAELAWERARLDEAGVLAQLGDSCGGDLPLALR